MMFDLLLINGTIITVDDDNRVISDGYIAIKDQCIAEIGEMKSLSGMPSAKRVMDVRGHAVLPGLIDAHGHGGLLLKEKLSRRELIATAMIAAALALLNI